MKDDQPWVTDVPLEMMLQLALPHVGPEPGIFQEGDEVLLQTGGASRRVVGVLVLRQLAQGGRLRIQIKDDPNDELWAYWPDVVGWRRPSG